MICEARDEKYLDAIEKLIAKDIPRAENPLGTAPAADETTDDKPKRSRSRKPKREDEVVAAESPENDEAPKERRPRGGRRREDRGPKIIGMGDHMPSFIEKSFEERLAS